MAVFGNCGGDRRRGPGQLGSSVAVGDCGGAWYRKAPSRVPKVIGLLGVVRIWTQL